jgi:N4-gp56 family major capsid protein
MALTGITSAPNITSTLTDVDLKVYSNKVLFASQPDLVWEQLAERQTELDRQPGQTIQFLKFNDTVEGDELIEGNHIGVDDITTSTVDISVKEWGKGFAMTELLLRTSAYNVMEAMVKLMADNYAKTSNLAYVRTVFQNVPSFLYGNDRPTRAGLTGSDLLNVEVLKLVSEDFANRLVPPLKPRRENQMAQGAKHIALIHPHQAHSISNDPEFIKAKHYGAPQDLFTGEIGMYENIRLIKTTFLPVVKHPGTYTPFGGGAPVTPAANVGHVFINGVNMTDRKPLMFPAQTIVPGSPPIYQACFLGDRSLALAEVLPVQVRHGGIVDFERERQLAWYAIRGTGTLNPDRLLIYESY